MMIKVPEREKKENREKKRNKKLTFFLFVFF